MNSMIKHTTRFSQPIADGNAWLKPLKVEFSVTFSDTLDPEKILELAKVTEEGNSNATLATIPLWAESAEKLGFIVTFNVLGSLLDPRRLLLVASYKLMSYLLKKAGRDEYKRLLKIQ
jgi:hypothetical protein